MNCQYSDSVQDRYIVPSFAHPYFPCVSPSKQMEDAYLNTVPYGSLKTNGEYGEYDSRVKAASQELPQGFSVNHLLDLHEARVRGQPYLNESVGYPGDCQTSNAGQTGFGFQREEKEGPYHVKGEHIRPSIGVGGDAAMQDPPSSAGPGSTAFEERLTIKQQTKTPTPETKKKPKGIHAHFHLIKGESNPLSVSVSRSLFLSLCLSLSVCLPLSLGYFYSAIFGVSVISCMESLMLTTRAECKHQFRRHRAHVHHTWLMSRPSLRMCAGRS